VNLPNTITLGRIFLVPLLVVVLLTGFDGREVFGVSNEILGAAIFALASITDWLDGFLARRRGQVTGLGQWMDPLADKLLVTAALISLVQLGREFAVTVLRSIVHARGSALPASPVGKIKMAAEVVAILLLILGPRHMAEFFVLGQIALWVATVAALVSAVDYSRKANAFFAGRPAPLDVKSSADHGPDQTRPVRAAGRNRLSA
jgi:CDP-diacylglycerol--glycerol-3-phosphate 3-phosphatidyltransferase